jgi:hypothetical protein
MARASAGPLQTAVLFIMIRELSTCGSGSKGVHSTGSVE